MGSNAYHAIFTLNLRRLVRESGWTTLQIADISGVQAKSIYAYLRGDSVPGIENALKLCGVLNVDMNELTCWEPS